MSEERLKEIKDSIYIAHRISCDPAISMDFRDKEDLYNEVVRLKAQVKLLDDNRIYLNNKIDKAIEYIEKEKLDTEANEDYIDYSGCFKYIIDILRENK